MKFNFKKIASVLTSTVMLSSTLALAAAANFPAPFVSGGNADVAIVYGSSPLAQDQVAVLDINTALTGAIASGSTSGSSSAGSVTASGGDSYKLEKTSTKYHIGDAVADVISVTVDSDELPELLADGTFMDNDNDEFDFTQKLTLANWSLTMFDDNDYKADTPTVGVKIASGAPVLNYTLKFSESPLWTDLETSDLMFMGKPYYVLSTNTPTNTSITLLDSADSLILNEGETKTVSLNGKTYDVSLNFIGSSSVKLDVNGEVTNSLNTGSANTFKLKDGTYVGVKEINVQDYAGGSKNVEFSLGSGKLQLTTGSEVEINDDAISGLSANFSSSSGALNQVDLVWKADDDLFVTEDKQVTMPGFGAVKLSYAGVTFPAEEEISVEADEDTSIALKNFPLKDSTEDINLLFSNGANFTEIGKDATSVLRTSNSSLLSFDADTDEYFVASWTDGNDAESYLMRATSFQIKDATNRTTVEYKKDGSWKTVNGGEDAEDGDTISIGSVDLTIGTIEKAAKTVNFTGASGVSFSTLYSKEGLKVFLPFNVTLTSVANIPGAFNLSNSSTFALRFSEENKDEDKGVGRNITLTLGHNSNGDTSVTNVALTLGGTSTEIGNTDVERNFVYSALATEVLWDKGPDQQKAKLIYHGGESDANLFVAAPSVTVGGGGGSTGSLSVTDSDVSTVSGKNLIVVGGGCINTVAASLLGSSSPLCGDAWQAKTNVGAGSFLIQTFASPYSSSKIATLVAGYNQPDTANAAKYLTTQSVDVGTAGKKLVGTTATQATLVTS